MSAKASTAASRLASNTWLQLVGLLFMVVLAYGNTLDVPFYLDDFSSIRENPLIYDWRGVEALWRFAPLRVIGYLTFALNYALDHFDTSGYHLFNIGIHFLTVCGVYALARGLLRTPVLEKKVSPRLASALPPFAAALFALHPLQIQAVTYIVQRLAAMAALFYVLTMVCFIQARLATRARTRHLWAAACLLLALLGLFTKQNTFTLPLALLLLEGLFFRPSARRLVLLVGGLVALGGVGLVLLSSLGSSPLSLESMQALTRETDTISRGSYLATQMSVLWTYIRLFWWPVGLHIDRDFPLAESFAQTGVVVALLGHLASLTVALLARRRWPLVSFALVFYYLAHGIESSFLPIRDVVFEHRTYLPNLGLCLLLAWGLLQLPGLAPTKAGQRVNWRVLGLFLPILLVALGITTWQRNQVWRDPISLWGDNVAKAPDKARPWTILGKHLLEAGRNEEAVAALRRAVDIQRRTAGGVDLDQMVNLIVGLEMLRRHDEALALTQQLLERPMNPLMRAKLLINRGTIYYELGRAEEAESSLRQAIEVYPAGIIARANLASILGNRGRFDAAEALYREVLRIHPGHAPTQRNLRELERLRAQAGRR